MDRKDDPIRERAGAPDAQVTSTLFAAVDSGKPAK